MNSVKILVDPHLKTSEAGAVAIPVFVPDREQVRRLAVELHAQGKSWEGEVLGWAAEYQAEIKLDSVEIEEYDDDGNRRLVTGPFWSPAAFMIGEPGVWFYSLSWERGSDSEPVEFVDDRNLVSEQRSEPVLHEPGPKYRVDS